MNGAPNDGLTESRAPKHQLEYTGTCMLSSFKLRSMADSLAEPPSREVPGLVSGGDLRSYFLTRPSTLQVSINFSSLLEIHMFLVTLVRQFEFSLPDGAPQVRRWRPGFVIPVVEGKEHEGVQLPLKVTPVKTK